MFTMLFNENNPYAKTLWQWRALYLATKELSHEKEYFAREKFDNALDNYLEWEENN